jgi:hypothetical protein
MGFTDEVGIGGGKPILKFNKEARYVKRGSEDALNDQEFVAKIGEARAGYIKFNGNEEPERRLGAIFPKDEAPLRSSLGDTDKSKWPKGKFSDGPEDPWTAVVEIPLQHRETGEEYLFAAQRLSPRRWIFSRRPSACRRDLTPSSASVSAVSSPASGQ